MDESSWNAPLQLTDIVDVPSYGKKKAIGSVITLTIVVVVLPSSSPSFVVSVLVIVGYDLFLRLSSASRKADAASGRCKAHSQMFAYPLSLAKPILLKQYDQATLMFSLPFVRPMLLVVVIRHYVSSIRFRPLSMFFFFGSVSLQHHVSVHSHARPTTYGRRDIVYAQLR